MGSELTTLKLITWWSLIGGLLGKGSLSCSLRGERLRSWVGLRAAGLLLGVSTQGGGLNRVVSLRLKFMAVADVDLRPASAAEEGESTRPYVAPDHYDSVVEVG